MGRLRGLFERPYDPSVTHQYESMNREEMMEDHQAMSTGVILGLAIGVSVALAVIIVATLAIIFSRRRHRKQMALSVQEAAPQKKSPDYKIRPPLEKTRLVRSVTADMIPEFVVPPDRLLQPPTAERRASDASLDLGEVEPALYWSCKDDDEEAPMTRHGRLWFSVVYDAAVQQLTVELIKAKGLRPRDKTNAPRDVFVKLFMLPDERICQESKLRKRTLTPKFNEKFIFQMKEEDVLSNTLRFSIYDVDKKKGRQLVGHVILPLCDMDLTRGDTLWQDLEPPLEPLAPLGEIHIGLMYIPGSDKVKVVILSARNLRRLEYDTGKAVFVRVQFLSQDKIQKNQAHTSSRRYLQP